MNALAEWDSFYVIVGSAAGALIGLQFVVMTLIAEHPPPRAVEASKAFATPTVIHFGAALLLSALARAPWENAIVAATTWGMVGIGGIAYSLIVVKRIRLQDVYSPDLEDWSFHFLLPFLSYALLLLSALLVQTRIHEALFGVGAATLLLLFTGIHNAWDAVVHHVFVRRPNRDSAPK